MTEIPEHLLKRSRERRAAMGGDAGATDGGGTSESAQTTPAAAKAASAPATAPSMPAHPEPETVPAAPPPSPMVEAYRRRRKIPFWAMPVLAALPLWAYIYQGTLSPPPAGEGPELLGAELYASSGCAGCHGAGGGGGVGPGFTGGAIYETFPDWITHFEWVRLGSAGWLDERGQTYGANEKPVQGGMPGFTEDQLTDYELIYVILHERLLGGENPNEEDMLQLEELALFMSENSPITLEEAIAELGIEVEVGTEGGQTDPGRGDPPPDQAPEQEDTPGSEGNEQPSDGGESDQTGDGGSNSGQGGGGGDEETPAFSEGGDAASP
ncbi:MAG: c-type cytochrome [Acidimicrobiia bacterium]